MKRTLLMSYVLLFAAAVASAQFEGVADFTITMNGEQGKPTSTSGRMSITRGAFRSEWTMTMPGAARGRRDAAKDAPSRVTMTMLARKAEPDKLYMLNDEKKTYSVTDLKKVREEARDLPKETYKVERLGSDRVAGLACQKALVSSAKGSEYEVCVTKDLDVSGDWLAAMNRGQRDAGSWIQALRDNGLDGYPVRWAMRRQGAAQPTMVMELTRVEKKSLPASLFEVPAGYKQTEMAVGGMTPEQEKAMGDARAQMKEALEKMTPEERKAYEDAMKRYAQPTPEP
jgi:hypothetical protein